MPYWEDGAASSALETALTRSAVDRLVQGEATGQYEHGADILWIDCDRAGSGSAGRLVELVQSGCPCAVCVAGSDVKTVEEAVRAVEGRAFAMLRGSVSTVVEQLLPLAKRYGAAVVAGTDIGSGEGTPEERLRVSSRIVEAAKDLGMTRSDVLVHVGCLFDSKGGIGAESLRAIKLIKSELSVNVVADCAPAERSDTACLSGMKSAVEAGADAVIADPLDPGVQAAMKSFRT
jgi:5-methyltetrahydrofolate--homocysteine methyltransferase